MKTKWKLLHASLYGALLGVLASIIGPIMSGGTMPSDPTMLLGNLLGGAVVGVVGGIAVALIRNSQIKAG